MANKCYSTVGKEISIILLVSVLLFSGCTTTMQVKCQENTKSKCGYDVWIENENAIEYDPWLRYEFINPKSKISAALSVNPNVNILFKESKIAIDRNYWTYNFITFGSAIGFSGMLGGLFLLIADENPYPLIGGVALVGFSMYMLFDDKSAEEAILKVIQTVNEYNRLCK
jgi:hypothetical protein